MKRPVPLPRYPVRSLRPLANFDLSAARDVLGWQPRIGVRRGLEGTFGNQPPRAASATAATASGRPGIDA